MITPKKQILVASFTLTSMLLATQSVAEGADTYVGVFGGGGSTSTTSIQQTGTAFYDPPKPVNA